MNDGSRLPLAVTLAAIAGWVDAVGYLHFAHVFVSFMSGNSTVLGIALGQGTWSHALSPALAIGAFVLGSFMGTLIGASAGRWRSPAVLAFETVLLVLAFVVPASGGDLAPAIVPLAVAMGAQNAVMHSAAGVRVALTYITGTLYRLGQSLAEAVLGQSERWTWSIYAAMWIALMSGAIGGAIVYAHIGFEALIAPAVVFGILGLIEATLVFITKRRERIKASP